jgi:tetratricopeptide (TPR) repeat protein
MRVFAFILIYISLLQPGSLKGQCPTRDSLWNRMIFYQKSSIPYADQLKEYLRIDSLWKTCSQRPDSLGISLLLNIGVSYFRLADYVHAVRYTREALDLIQANADNPAINSKILGKYYYFLSIYYDSLKMPLERYEAIDSVISNELKINANYHYASLVLQANVRNLFGKGDYYLCLERATLGETLIHKFYRYEDSMNYVIYFIYYQANALRLLKKFTEEEKFLESKKSEFQKSKNKDYTGVIFSLFGDMFESRGDFPNAIRYYQKAYDNDVSSKYGEISSDVLDKIGAIYSEKLGQHQLALQYFYKALHHARYKVVSNASVSDSFYILDDVANVYVRLKLFDSAFYFFQSAFDKIRPGMHESDLALDLENFVNANTVEAVINLVLGKGNAYLQLYKEKGNPDALVQALKVFKIADHLLTKIREEQAEIQSRLFWQTDAHSLYEHAVEAAYLQNNISDAFYFFEKSRAVLLNDQLKQGSKISNGIIQNQALLKRKILFLEREREITNMSSARGIDIQKELIAGKQALARLDNSIRSNNPLYSQSTEDTSFVSISDIRKDVLRDHAGLLEIFSGDSACYSVFITKGNTLFNRVSKPDFDSTVNLFILYLSNSSLMNRYFDRYILTAQHLYQLIFGENVVPEGRIIISPDEKYFPFEALVINTGSDSPDYFLNKHAVSYTYSARYLLTNFSGNSSKEPGNFLGVAPVSYISGSELAALQGSDVSLLRIEDYFDYAHTLISAEASKRNFQQSFSDYKIIQLYTHASDSSKQGEPVIFFADSVLYLSDLIPETLPRTQLIVLSACETGKGKVYQGEGVFSFNRGFASMGIPASITNLWSVDNKSTYQITELFYKFLAGGLPVDIALQKAKLEFIKHASKENKLPFYWAATILAGRSDKIALDKNFPWKDLLIITGLMGLAFLVYQKVKAAGKTKFYKQGIIS